MRGSGKSAWLVLVVASIAASSALGARVAPGAPGAKIDQKEVCLSCHDLSEAMASKVRHPPVVDGKCTACHSPHASRFDALLRERPGPLCTQCHPKVGKELQRPVVHAPAAEGRCTACHSPHGAAYPGLLKKKGADLCSSCHAEVAQWRGRKVQHPPFALGDCDKCHEPHGSEGPGLLVSANGEVCFSCHRRDATFRKAHKGYPVEKAACWQCHDPHASERRGLFRETIHPPFSAGECGTCHAGPKAAKPFALVEPVGQLCAECHDDVVTAAKNAAFPHVPAGGGDCIDCHNPHTGSGSAMLKEDTNALCLSCHDPGGAKSSEKGRYLSHGAAGKGLACTTCHQPHGGDRPLLLAKESIDLCGSCHQHEHGASHPLGEGTRDPRNGNPMTCRSCHSLHDGAYKFYLIRSPDHELCVGCHKGFEKGAKP